VYQGGRVQDELVLADDDVVVWPQLLMLSTHIVELQGVG